MKKYFLGAILLLLTACQPMLTRELYEGQVVPWPVHKKQLEQISSLMAQGVVALCRKDKWQNASFYFSDQGETYRFEIYGPLGTGRNILMGNAKEVTFINGDGKAFKAKSLEALLKQRLGWSVPVSNLRYWGLGLPFPKVHYKMRLNKFQVLLQLKQKGWTIQYENYILVKNIALPTKVILTNPQLKITLVIKKWEIN